MYTILKQEISSFFSSAVGYLVVAFFILANGLVLWVFKGAYNILDFGFADLSLFFLWAPWMFLLLIPAITMRSFSEELKTGTIELLKIKPITTRSLVLGKFLGSWVLTLIAILPTLLYLVSVEALSLPTENIDRGIIFSSYLGLVLLTGTYCAVGVWTSSITENQIVAFVLAAIISWFLFAGFQGLSTLFPGTTAISISSWGMQYHFEEFTRGLVALNDLFYFLSLMAFFLLLSFHQISKK